MRLPLPVFLIAAVFAATAAPAAGEDDPQLRKALSTFLRGADTMRLDVVPDLYEGGYARISVYARGARLADSGLRVDEGWVRLVGATFNVAKLRAGRFSLDSVRDSAIYLRVSLRSLEQYFIAGNPWDDIRLWVEGGYLHGRGTVPLSGVRTRVEMKGFFGVSGTNEVFFYVDRLAVNGLPLPHPLLRQMEREYNPIITQKDWPVTFKLRSVRLRKDDLVLSSQADASTCLFCGGGDLPTVSP